MLEVRTQAFGLEGGPHGELQHGVRVAGPGGEAVGVEGEFLLHAVDDFLIFEEEDLHRHTQRKLASHWSREGRGARCSCPRQQQQRREEGLKGGGGITYRSGSSLEHAHLAASRLPLLSRNNRLEDLGSNVPQLLVVGTKEHDDAVRLRVEGRGDLVQEVLNDLLDAVLRDGQVLGQGVVAAALLGQVDQGLGVGGHFVLLLMCGGSGEESGRSSGNDAARSGEWFVGCCDGRGVEKKRR